MKKNKRMNQKNTPGKNRVFHLKAGADLSQTAAV